MNFRFKTAATVLMAASLVCSSAIASDATPPVKKHAVAKKAKTPPPPTVQEQIQALRQELEGQINGLKTDLADKDAQLKKAQQAAADAQAAADKAQAAASAQQQAVSDNAAAVTTLQTTVTDMKSANVSVVQTISDETAAIKKSINSPSVLHYKGVTLTPYGFLNGESVWRSKATGGELPTAFSAIPYEHADAYSLSEFYYSGRQSRVGFSLEGKTSWGTLRAIVEGDFLGVGTTSNDNQSTSFLYRQRIALGEVETNSHWTFSAGQGWSLAAENKKGITTPAANVALPNQIDPNYVTGLVWTRAGGFRVAKNFKTGAVAVSLENPQLLFSGSMAGNTPYAVLGTQGVGGGLFNAAISACSPATSIVNYTNQADVSASGGSVPVAVPVYKTVNSCANLANVSFNQAPDVLVKAVLDPSFGHFEVFGIARFAHETIYPGETTNGNLYGGLTDVAASATAGSTVLAAPTLTTAGAISNSIKLGGLGASARVNLIPNKLVIGAKGLFGPGVGRYGDTTLSDVTANAAGALRPIHNVSGLLSVDVTPTPRLLIYAYYGGDYAGREDYGSAATTTLGAPSATFCPTTAGAFACTSSPTAADITLGGKWGATWKAPSAAAVGYGSRLLSNSGCNTTSNPGYNGSSTGFYPGGSCGAQTRDVQEITGGYWYDIYKGDRGRLRQGLQYGYTVRQGWSDASGIGAKGIDNLFFTSLRYYLP